MRALVAFCPILFVVGSELLLCLSAPRYEALFDEDGVFEAAQALVLFASGLLAVALAVNRIGRGCPSGSDT